MKRRALPETRPYYESLAAEFRAGRQFFEAGDRLEAWDYQDADATLVKAKKALDAAQPGAAAIPDPGRRAEYEALLAGWNGVVDAEHHHAAALKSLLADASTAKAKDEFLLGVADYRRAQADFEKAGFPSGSTAIEKIYARLRDRAAAVAQAFGIPEAALTLGKTSLGSSWSLWARLLRFAPVCPLNRRWSFGPRSSSRSSAPLACALPNCCRYWPSSYRSRDYAVRNRDWFHLNDVQNSLDAV